MHIVTELKSFVILNCYILIEGLKMVPQSLCKVILLCILVVSSLSAETKYSVSGQDKNFPLFTEVSPENEKELKTFFSGRGFEKESLGSYKKMLKPYADKNDPLGLYYYAKCFDLFEFGCGDSVDAITALKYYEKAAKTNYAKADEFLYDGYKYSFMGIDEDCEKAYKYLTDYVSHTDSSNKFSGYLQLARVYLGNGEWGCVPSDSNLTIYYLKKALAQNPTDMTCLDFLGGIYEEREMYDSAVVYNAQSGNEISKAKAGAWLVRGKKVSQDKEKGLALLYAAADVVLAQNDNPNDFMGSPNPIYLLNDLYKYDSLITKEQLGKYEIEGYFRDF